MNKNIEERKEKILDFLSKKKTYLVYLALAFIVFLSSYIRTRNLPLLQGKYLADPDSDLFLRYAEYIAEHGKIMSLDLMRNFPVGYDTSGENIILSYIIAYVYKFLKIFNTDLTVVQVDIFYPVVAFAIALIIFFLLVRRLFDDKAALIATAFYAVLPASLHRTTAGIADKEPIGIIFMLLTFYFYIAAIQSKNTKHKICLGLLSGISTGIMGLAWGGVQYIFVIIPVFVLIEFFLSKITNDDFYIYASWAIPLILILTNLTGRFNIQGIVYSTTASLTILTLIILTINYIVENYFPKIKNKTKDKIPFSIVILSAASLFTLLLASITYGSGFIYNNLGDIIPKLLNPIGKSRFISTVAEASQPYFLTWINQLGNYFYLFIAGSIILFYNTIKSIDKKFRIPLTVLYTIFIFTVIMSKYSSSSKFNGDTSISVVLYIGSLIVFPLILLGLFLYAFYKNKELFKEITNIDKKYTLVFMWFLASVIATRGAIRLFFVLAPITAVLVGYLWSTLYNYAITINKKHYRIFIYAVLIFILIGPGKVLSLNTNFTFLHLAKESNAVNHYVGPGYNLQWQQAMEWVKQNTPTDSVFAHWWDYGYWVQTGGDRATITDGGNAIGYWNYLMGRHVLTGASSDEALPVLKSHNASHLLIIGDEIGKYPAYTLIGSDPNLDRYSFIPTIVADPNEIQETKNGYIYTFRTGVPLDQDLNYNNKIIPQNSAYIAGILLPIIPLGSDQLQIQQPIAVLSYNNERIDVPMECVFTNGQEILFENAGIKSCLMLIPYLDGTGQVHYARSALYLSPKVRNTLFTQMYLFGKEWPGFKLVYNDESSNFNLVYYAPQSRIVGPLKMWEIEYPENMELVTRYLHRAYPTDVPS